MVVPTLAVAACASLSVGVSFLFVAWAVHGRPGERAHRLPRAAHAAWWGALGAYLVLHGALTLAAAFDGLDPALYRASRVLAIPLLCGATWGIAFYLTYLYTGRASAALPLALAYGAVMILFFAATFGASPDVHVARWHVGLDDDTPLFRLVYVLVGVPPILASLAYLALLRVVHDPTRRARILLGGIAILAYVLSGLVARLADHDALIFGTLVLGGGAAAIASLLANGPTRLAQASSDGGT